jgi:hypothetical protein
MAKSAAGAVAGDGPEHWATIGGADWTYWDLWMCVACHLDAKGDWDEFDRLLTEKRTTGDGRPSEFSERLWSHLLDLRPRIEAAGLSPEDLAVKAITGAPARARAKLYKRSLSERDMSASMLKPPSTCLEQRAEMGSWPQFPRDPQIYLDQLEKLVTYRGYGYQQTSRLTDDLPVHLELLEKTTGDDVASLLALHRAGLTFAYRLANYVDDSSDDFGNMARCQLDDYVALDWRATGLDPHVYWHDLLQYLCHAENFGMVPVPG